MIAVVLLLSATAQSGDDKKSFDPFSEEPAEEEVTLEPEGEPAPEPEVPATKIEDARPKVLVLLLADIPSGTSVANRIGAEATRRLAKQKQLAPAVLEEVLAPNAKQRRATELKEALAQAEKGMRAFEELDLETAGSDLESGINSLLAYSDDLDARAKKTLEQAIFASGATILFEGQTALAESIFVALLLLNPTFSPDAEAYPSNVVSRFNDLKAKVEARPTAGLSVSTNPAGGDVYVDGSFRGGSPLEIGGLADGQHIVVVRRAGYKPFGTLVPVTVERTASVEVDLEAEEGPVLPIELDVSMSRSANGALAIGKKLGVSKLAVFSFARRISGSKIQGLWVDVEKGAPISTIAEMTILEDPDSAAQAIADAIARSELGPIAAATPEEVETPVTDRWWFWALAGSLAVAAAGAATVAIVSGANDNDTRPPPSTVVLGF